MRFGKRNSQTYPKPKPATTDTRQIETASKKGLCTHGTIETLIQASTSLCHPKPTLTLKQSPPRHQPWPRWPCWPGQSSAPRPPSPLPKDPPASDWVCCSGLAETGPGRVYTSARCRGRCRTGRKSQEGRHGLRDETACRILDEICG